MTYSALVLRGNPMSYFFVSSRICTHLRHLRHHHLPRQPTANPLGKSKFTAACGWRISGSMCHIGVCQTPCQPQMCSSSSSPCMCVGSANGSVSSKEKSKYFIFPGRLKYTATPLLSQRVQVLSDKIILDIFKMFFDVFAPKKWSGVHNAYIGRPR